MRFRPKRFVILLVGALVAACSSNGGTNTVTPRLVVAPDTVLSLIKQDTVQLTVSAIDQQGHLLTGIAITFASADTTIVKVSALGTVKSLGPLGTVLVTVSGGGVSQGVHVTVINIPASVVVTPADTTIRQGKTAQLTAKALDNTGTPVPGLSFTWSSSDASFATVSANGLVTTVGSAGAVIIAAQVHNLVGSATVHIQDTSIVATLLVSARPFGIAVSAQNVVYVTQLDAAALARVDLPTIAVSGSVSVGATPTSVAFGLSGATAYVANQLSSTEGVVTVATNTQGTTISLGGNPFMSRVSPDGKFLGVTTNNDSVYAINISTNTIAHRFGFPSVSNGLAFHPTNDSLLYASFLDGTVKEINYKRDAIVRSFSAGLGDQGVAVAPDASELYVADQVGAHLEVVNLTSGAVTTSIPLPAHPFDLELSPDGAKIWVGFETAGKVLEFDRTTRTLLRTIVTGGAPRRIAFNAAGTMAIIANEGGWVDFVK